MSSSSPNPNDESEDNTVIEDCDQDNDTEENTNEKTEDNNEEPTPPKISAKNEQAKIDLEKQTLNILFEGGNDFENKIMDNKKDFDKKINDVMELNQNIFFIKCCS